MLSLLCPKQLLAWCLAGVLVLTQTLGLIHGVTHVEVFAVAAERSHRHVDLDHHIQHGVEVHQATDHDFAAAPASGLLASVFAWHTQDSDCRLFDQCSHGAGVANPPQQLLPVVMPPFEVAIFQGNALARWAALFDARGPPLTV